MNYATRQTNSQNSALSTESVSASSSTNALRGMSFAEGAAALSPDNVQMMPSGLNVQKDDKKVPKDDKGPPEAIANLGLKRVRVVCRISDWAKLEPDEQDIVLGFLETKEAYCNANPGVSPGVDITIGSKVIEYQPDAYVRKNEYVPDAVLDGLEGDAQQNMDAMKAGDSPVVGWSHGTGKTIAINRGELKTEIENTEKIIQVPVMETKQLDATIGSAGSTFDSADYKPEDMQEGGVMDLLVEAAAKIAEFLAIDPNARITLNVDACESFVPNPKEFGPGKLAEARAKNGVALAKAHFAQFEGADIQYTETSHGPEGDAWDGVDAHADKYTKYQYVHLNLSAEVQQATGDMRDVPVSEEIVHESNKAERVFIVVSTRGGSSGGTTVGNGSGGSNGSGASFVDKKVDTTSCPK